MDNYTNNDARLFIIEFTYKNPSPYLERWEKERGWEKMLVRAALEQGHKNGYTQCEEKK